MLFAYRLREGTLERSEVPPGGPVPDDAVWLDLFDPRPGEDALVERALGIAVPTREEMVEIEPSSRLYTENGATFMTGSIVCNADSERPTLAAVSFILAGRRLVTVRYDEPKPFRLVTFKLGKTCSAQIAGDQLLMELLDAIIDRAADIIEHLGAEIDGVSQRIFERNGGRSDQNQRYRALLRIIARKGDLASKVRESLVSMARLVTFLAAENGEKRVSKEQRATLKSMQRDVSSLTDHVSYLANKITFLLDATLGMVSIEQNNIIKIFAVLSVVLMPPTLIASIYGMNFQYMPELGDRLGYPLALLAMLVAAILPYWFFKWKRWL
ncbi:magnesium/cobalt transporter CorA [Bosea sp. 117]|uniref:magnesium/cobalt transporter CorA n=1 Tax=Bosea sp. 117 TaxID=1125973 RepID=UPI0004945BE1|nr:magnesium/cobalt transporter CorA [Bosea sp. 117]